MATNFPASLDTLTNPTSSDSLSSPSHSAQHANVNDAVEALQAKVGADSSAVSSSLDYKVADHASRITTLEGAGSYTYTDYSASMTFQNFTLGNGSISYARYVQIGEFVHFCGRFNLGSTSSFSGTPFAITSLPVTPDREMRAAGQFWAEESGVGARFGLCRVTPTQLLVYAYQETGSYIRADNVDGTTPFTWGTNDYLEWSVIYQAA